MYKIYYASVIRPLDKARVLRLASQSCPTLCDPRDCSHQAPLAVGFSRQEYWRGLPSPPPGDLPNPEIKPRCPALQVDSFPSEPPRKLMNTGVGSLPLLQRIFLTQELNRDLLHCRQILYQLSHKRSPRILEWIAYPFSRGSSQPGIEPGSPALQVDSIPTEL